jgi:hypothetical protein
MDINFYQNNHEPKNIQAMPHFRRFSLLHHSGNKKQSGDDWDDAPYEHNAGPPYPKEGHEIIEVKFSSVLLSPADQHAPNSLLSVEAINDCEVPWLTSREEEDKKISIFAGDTLGEFIDVVIGTGGSIFFKSI